MLSTVAIHAARNSRSGFGIGCADRCSDAGLNRRIASTSFRIFGFSWFTPGFLNWLNLRFIDIADATERAARNEVRHDIKPRTSLFLFQKADDVCRILLYAFRPSVFSKFLRRRVCFADADRQLVPPTGIVDGATRNYEDGGLVGDLSRERIDLETVFGISAAEQSIRQLPCGCVFHMQHCIICNTRFRFWFVVSGLYFVV